MDSETKSVLFFIGVGIVFGASLLAWLSGFNFGRTENGTVVTDNCQASVNLTLGDWGTYFHHFYCIGGFCQAVEIKDGKCAVSYSYIQQSAN